MTEAAAVKPEKPIRPISLIHWYVAIAQPNMDVRVARDLGEQGFEVFLALNYKRERSANRAWIEAHLRLSPYVFVGLDEAKKLSLKAVRDTFGVSGVVTLSADKQDDVTHATEVPPETIAGLRLDQLADYEAAARRVRRNESPYKEGDEIVVRPGHVFAGQVGKVISARNAAVVVELGFSGFPVRLLDDDVSPAQWMERRHA